MAKIDFAGWLKDKARREDRVSRGLCPMCAALKRAEDEFCSDACKLECARGAPSKEPSP